VTDRDVEIRDHACAGASQKFGEVELRERATVKVRRSNHQGTNLAHERSRRCQMPSQSTTSFT
jgi:hypothetical protein